MQSHGPATSPSSSLGRADHFAEHFLNSFGRQCLGPSGFGSLLETSKPQVQYALAPQSQSHRTGAQSIGNLLVVLAVCGKQSDASPSPPLLGRSWRLDQALKFRPLLWGGLQWNLRTCHVQTMARLVYIRKDNCETLH